MNAMKCYFVPFFPAVLSFYLVSSSTGQCHPNPFRSTLCSKSFVGTSYMPVAQRSGLLRNVDSKTLRAVQLVEARCASSGRQVCIILNTSFSQTKNTIFRRPTGWHGEGGAASGGHITVRFRASSGRHITTNHVYPTDDVYRLCKWLLVSCFTLVKATEGMVLVGI